jgi:hypothetical protein
MGGVLQLVDRNSDLTISVPIVPEVRGMFTVSLALHDDAPNLQILILNAINYFRFSSWV